MCLNLGTDSDLPDVDIVSQWDNSLCSSICGDGSFEMGIKRVGCQTVIAGWLFSFLWFTMIIFIFALFKWLRSVFLATTWKWYCWFMLFSSFNLELQLRIIECMVVFSSCCGETVRSPFLRSSFLDDFCSYNVACTTLFQMDNPFKHYC